MTFRPMKLPVKQKKPGTPNTLLSPEYTPTHVLLDNIQLLIKQYVPLLRVFESKMIFKDDGKPIDKTLHKHIQLTKLNKSKYTTYKLTFVSRKNHWIIENS